MCEQLRGIANGIAHLLLEIYYELAFLNPEFNSWWLLFDFTATSATLGGCGRRNVYLFIICALGHFFLIYKHKRCLWNLAQKYRYVLQHHLR